jgi:hypothetical protein
MEGASGLIGGASGPCGLRPDGPPQTSTTVPAPASSYRVNRNRLHRVRRSRHGRTAPADWNVLLVHTRMALGWSWGPSLRIDSRENECVRRHRSLLDMCGQLEAID